MVCRPFGHYSLCVWAESTRLPRRANRINQVGISKRTILEIVLKRTSCVTLPQSIFKTQRPRVSKPKLYSTHVLFEEPRRKLAEHFDVEYWAGEERPTRPEVLKRVVGKDALICLLTEKVDAELLIAAGPNLRIVANVAVGFDNIDVSACTARKVAVTNTPGVLDETTADFAWALLMAVARRVVEGDRLARSGAWKQWNFDLLCGTDVWGKTLGIIGFGRIGSAVARRASGFRMRVIYNSHVAVPKEVERELNAEYMPRERVLAEADFLSLHVPLNAQTRGLIGPAELAKMKPTAFLIN